jgi:hypothetical protein
MDQHTTATASAIKNMIKKKTVTAPGLPATGRPWLSRAAIDNRW